MSSHSSTTTDEEDIIADIFGNDEQHIVAQICLGSDLSVENSNKIQSNHVGRTPGVETYLVELVVGGITIFYVKVRFILHLYIVMSSIFLYHFMFNFTIKLRSIIYTLGNNSTHLENSSHLTSKTTCLYPSISYKAFV